MLLIHCLMELLLFVGVLCLSLFCYALVCVHSSFAIMINCTPVGRTSDSITVPSIDEMVGA